ncbi:MAG: 1-acyl-sn-glycerol-3-phosphate acyltransferase [Anaerolineales bacterium]|nr:1-acyl-sn-glycerol-3-phosphate acyltransferase [Anaerolineales bacterium]
MAVKVRYRVAWWRRGLTRPLLRGALRLLFRLLARIEITGKENIPARPYIVAINHVSIFDPPFIGVFWPVQMEAMGAVDIWSKPGQNVLAILWGGIQVHRGEVDRALFDKVFGALEAGHPLLIAPEGGRSHTPGMRAAKPGIAFLVAEAGVPVVPVGIVGTTDDFWSRAIRGRRPKLEMHIGEPIHLPSVADQGPARRAARQRNADLVMERIAALLPEEYRGVYAARAQAGQ